MTECIWSDFWNLSSIFTNYVTVVCQIIQINPVNKLVRIMWRSFQFSGLCYFHIICILQYKQNVNFWYCISPRCSDLFVIFSLNTMLLKSKAVWINLCEIIWRAPGKLFREVFVVPVMTRIYRDTILFYILLHKNYWLIQDPMCFALVCRLLLI